MSLSDMPVDSEAAERESLASQWLLAGLIALVAMAVAGLLLFRRRGQRPPQPGPMPAPMEPADALELGGLSEEQAKRRHQRGQDNAILFKPPYSKLDILKTHTLNLFNISLVGLSAVQFLLGLPVSAILTLVVLAIGLFLNITQEIFARWRLQKLEKATRPQATVVREGAARSIDPSMVVQGDILVVGAGDRILADGQVLGSGNVIVDESMLTGDPRQHARQAGHTVYAGSSCLSGHAAYEAQKVGDERLIASLSGGFEASQDEKTPLEKTIDRLLRFLLVMVALLIFLLLTDLATRWFPRLYADAVSGAATVIFGLAPASLLLMILVNYGMGSYGLKWAGALVHRTRSVETLAQATVICFAQQGILTGVGVGMERLDPEGAPALSDTRIRQILGSFAHSTSAPNRALMAMRDEFPGEQRPIREQAPFLSAYGWSGVAFDEADLRGVYVLGDPQVLGPSLSADIDALTRKPVPPLDALRQRFGSWGRALGQGARSDAAGAFKPGSVGEELPAVQPDEPPNADTTATPGSFFQGLAGRIRGLLGEEGPGPADAKPRQGAVDPAVREVVYLMAYQLELGPLHGDDGRPRLPGGLVPLCLLRYSERVRPEAIDTVRSLAGMGVDLKVFTHRAAERTAELLRQSGLGDSRSPLGAQSGCELEAMDPEQLGQFVVANTVFGPVTPEQEALLVTALRRQGEAVAVLGDGVADLQAMRQANISITRKRSSPAALGEADMVLLEKNPGTLLRVVDRGQRIGNSLFDILKLYLVQIGYLVLLILAIWGTGNGFPYQSKQGSLITIASILLPSLALSLWAPPGVLPRKNLGWILAQWVAPASVSIAAAAAVVYFYFHGRTLDIQYAQLATAYTLTLSGLVLVILMRPPWRAKVGAPRRSGNRIVTAWVLLLIFLVFALAPLPIMDQLIGLKPLRQPLDYLIVFLAVLASAATTAFLWRAQPFHRLHAPLAGEPRTE